MRSIYDINSDIERCVLLDADGNDIGTDWELLSALGIERDSKLEQVAVWAKNIKAEIDAIKAEEDKLYKRRKADEARLDGIKRYLMQNLQGENITSARVKVSYRTTRDCVVIDGDIAEEYCKITIEPSKTLIKNAIKEGKNVTGAHLEDRVSVTIR